MLKNCILIHYGTFMVSWAQMRTLICLVLGIFQLLSDDFSHFHISITDFYQDQSKEWPTV